VCDLSAAGDPRGGFHDQIGGFAAALALSSGLMVNQASAGSIAVTNPSFEILPSGGLPIGGCGVGCSYAFAPIPGWSNGGISGQFQPGSSSGNFTYFNYVPDGLTVAYADGTAIVQTVAPTSVAGKTYTLQVDVGERNDFLTNPGTVELIVGGIATVATGAAPLPGDWSNYTATYTAPTSGQAITIELYSPSQQGDWDNVRLSVSGVPESSTWAMMLAGFAGLGVAGYAGRRRARLPPDAVGAAS